MTARDEAAQAIAYELDGTMYAALVAVDAIPTDVLARLAIERGGLVREPATDNPNQRGLYRLVES